MDARYLLTKAECSDDHVGDVFQRGPVGKWNLKSEGLQVTFHQHDARTVVLAFPRNAIVCSRFLRPADALFWSDLPLDFLGKKDLVFAVNEKVAVLEELELFGNFFSEASKAFLVRRADGAKNTQLRANHFRKAVHLSFFGHPRLQDGYLVVGLDSKDGERDAHLRIIAFWAFCDSKLLAEHLP